MSKNLESIEKETQTAIVEATSLVHVILSGDELNLFMEALESYKTEEIFDIVLKTQLLDRMKVLRKELLDGRFKFSE